MACVRLRRGHWTLDFRDQRGIRRIIQTEWTEAKDKRKAEERLRVFRAQVDRSEYEAPSEQRNFADLVKAYLAQLDVRDFTRADYVCIINAHIQPFFVAMKLRAINPQAVEEFRAHMKAKKTKGGRPLAVRTINKTLTQLSQMLKYAERHRWVQSNPCNHVRKLKQSIAHQRRALDGAVLTPDECERLIAAAGSMRERVLFRMAIETGMRQGELFGLRWTDVDWASGRVFIRQSCRKRQESQPKTAASLRSIGLRPALLRELREWRLACPTAAAGAQTQDLVFPNSAGGFEDAHNMIRRHFHPALRRAGLRQIRFHDLRHTCASLLLAMGVAIKQVQAQLGHASAQITLDIYGHLMPDSGSPGADAFDTLFGGYKVVARAPKLLTAETLTHGLEEALEASETGT
jgi:integrase